MTLEEEGSVGRPFNAGPNAKSLTGKFGVDWRSPPKKRPAQIGRLPNFTPAITKLLQNFNFKSLESSNRLNKLLEFLNNPKSPTF